VAGSLSALALGMALSRPGCRLVSILDVGPIGPQAQRAAAGSISGRMGATDPEADGLSGPRMFEPDS